MSRLGLLAEAAVMRELLMEMLREELRRQEEIMEASSDVEVPVLME